MTIKTLNDFYESCIPNGKIKAFILHPDVFSALNFGWPPYSIEKTYFREAEIIVSANTDFIEAVYEANTE